MLQVFQEKKSPKQKRPVCNNLIPNSRCNWNSYMHKSQDVGRESGPKVWVNVRGDMIACTGMAPNLSKLPCDAEKIPKFI